MKIAIVAPSPVPFTVGGAENLWWGLLEHFNQHTPHQAELIKLPSPERDFWEVIDSYRRFSELDLNHFDMVISTKYPAWMVQHPNHVCYLQHRLRGLYDTYHFCRQPLTFDPDDVDVADLCAFMSEHWGERAPLSEWFGKMERLRGKHGLPPDLFNFPGPFIREIIHYLDGVALSAQAIRRFAAIARNVTRRDNYFPDGVPVDVIHHPSNLRDFKKGKADYLFTVSRLDNAKRVGLLIEAMKLVRTRIELRIAGTGPDEAKLKVQASGDERIKFLGFVNDADVIDLYADALAVPYIPYDEDYGLVTIEAMRSGKPVLTTTDAGGPLEFVRNGETGFAVPPEPAALAERIDFLCEHLAQTRLMGIKGENAVAHISWDNTVNRLLNPAPKQTAMPSSSTRRRKITVAVNFPVHPPRGGGQSRVFHLYRHLAKEFNVDVVSLAADDNQPFEAEIAPGLREIRVPRSPEHRHAETEIGRQVDWVPVTDVVLPELNRLTPEYLQALKSSARDADYVVASHPYLLPAIRAVAADKPIWYEAHNVECDLKQAILPPTPTGLRLREAVRAVEREACDVSQLIMVCSEEDGRRLTEAYGADADKVVVVPNGVDLESTTYVSPAERLAAKKAAGINGNFVALFMGSWHGPNLDAVRSIYEFARQLPDVSFLVLGSAGLAFQNDERPANVGLLGVVDDPTKDAILGRVDVAINPMTSGSGTNLKMLDYFAAGIPVISTAHGARGLGLVHGIHVEISELQHFPQAIFQTMWHEGLTNSRITAAHTFVKGRYDWGLIAAAFGGSVRRDPGYQLNNQNRVLSRR